MKRLSLTALTLAATGLSAFAGNWHVYDQNGNYYYGNYDCETGNGHLYDQNGNYYYSRGNSMYDTNGHYWYRSGNTWYQGN
jgi:hypothetical protein